MSFRLRVLSIIGTNLRRFRRWRFEEGTRTFEALFPIIVPRSYFKFGNWPGFYRMLNHSELAVTWVELSDGQTMSYVNKVRHRDIETSGRDVHQIAMTNLRQQSLGLFTHQKAEYDRILFGAMMYADGLGTSRLLLLPELRKAFPEGFWIGIPERSCGVIVPKNVSAEERDEALDMINSCYDEGLIPMLPGLHEPDSFEFAAS